MKQESRILICIVPCDMYDGSLEIPILIHKIDVYCGTTFALEKYFVVNSNFF